MLALQWAPLQATSFFSLFRVLRTCFFPQWASLQTRYCQRTFFRAEAQICFFPFVQPKVWHHHGLGFFNPEGARRMGKAQAWPCLVKVLGQAPSFHKLAAWVVEPRSTMQARSWAFTFPFPPPPAFDFEVERRGGYAGRVAAMPLLMTGEPPVYVLPVGVGV